MSKGKYKYLYGNRFDDGGDIPLNFQNNGLYGKDGYNGLYRSSGAGSSSGGSGSEGGSSGGGLSAMGGIASAVGSLGPEIISSIGQYNAPISENAELLGSYYTNQKKKYNKATGILGALGLTLFNDASDELTALEDKTANIIHSIKAPERADSLDEAMNNAANFRKLEYTFDNPYGSGTGFSNFMKSTGKGAIAGTSILPGWGTLGGATVGSLNYLINGKRNRGILETGINAAKNAIRERERITEDTINANIRNLNTSSMKTQMARLAYGGPLGVNLNPVNNALDYMQNEELLSYMTDDLDSRNKKSSLPMFAFGGALGGYGGDWSNGLSFIKAGGTHGQNPLGGVPMGIAQDGQPNLVEEGEAIWNDYVFSNRIKAPKKLLKKYKFGGDLDMSFAQMVDKLQESSAERPNDPIEKRTLDAILAELMQEQEMIRQRKEDRKQGQMEDMITYAANGGNLSRSKDYGSKKKPYPNVDSEDFAGGGRSYPIPTKADAIDALRLAGLHGRSDVKAKVYKKYPELKKALGGHLFYGGGYIDPVTGEWIETGNPMDDYRIQYPQARRPQSTIVAKPLAATPINQYVQPIYLEDNSPMNQYALATNPLAITSNSDLQQSSSIGSRRQTSTSSVAPTTPSTNDYRGATGNLPTSGWQTSLRYAPILGAGIGLAHTLFNKPDYEYANTLADLADTYANQIGHNITPRFLGDYLAYNPFDRLFYANELGAQQAATRKAILNTGNGNAGATMAALLAAGYNDSIGQGKLFREGEEYNLAQRQKVAEFNRGTNQFNAEADLKAQMFNKEAKDKIMGKVLETKRDSLRMKQAEDQAYQNALMANLTNLFQGLGDVGYEAEQRYWLNALANSGYFGTPNDSMFDIAYGKPRAKGGKLNRKKKGLTI